MPLKGLTISVLQRNDSLIVISFLAAPVQFTDQVVKANPLRRWEC